MNAIRPLNIAIDFDGTCVKHAYPLVGEDIGAQPVLHWLQEKGCRLILFTMRSGQQLQDAVDWFTLNNIPLFGVNENPEQSTWTTSPKVYAHVYIDDAALGCPLIEPKGERAYVNWNAVEQHLIHLLA
jgi:hypothetical protein